MKAWLERSSLDRLIHKAPYIVAAILVGLLSVGFGLMIDRLTEFSVFLLEQHPLLLFLVTPLAFVLARGIVQMLGTPAAGSGIPQVIATLRWEGEPELLTNRLLNVKVVLAKILSCGTALVGGAIVGREGPMVQIGAAVFLSVGRRMRRFVPQIDEYGLIVAGGAAGVAAAFNTPLGGIVFAIEELIDQHFSRVRSQLIVGVIIAGMMAQSLIGPYLYFGALRLRDPTWLLLGPMLVVSIVLGLLGGLFGKLLIIGQRWLARLSNRQRLLWAAFCGCIIAGSLYLNRAEAPYAVGGGTRLIRDILWEGTQVSPWFIVHRYVGSLISFLSGISGGVFAPALATGAALGKALSSVFSAADPVALTLIGMVSFLAAVSRAPFTSMVLVMEMTNGHAVALHILFASLIAVGVARLVEPEGYYHFQSHFYLKQARPNPDA